MLTIVRYIYLCKIYIDKHLNFWLTFDVIIQIPNEEKKELVEKFKQASYNMQTAHVEEKDYYKVRRRVMFREPFRMNLVCVQHSGLLEL